jgi:hypothetical protein
MNMGEEWAAAQRTELTVSQVGWLCVLGNEGERTFEEYDSSEVQIFGVCDFVQLSEGWL